MLPGRGWLEIDESDRTDWHYYLLIVRYQPLLSLLQSLLHLSEIRLQLGILWLVILPQLGWCSVNLPDSCQLPGQPTTTHPPSQHSDWNKETICKPFNWLTDIVIIVTCCWLLLTELDINCHLVKSLVDVCHLKIMIILAPLWVSDSLCLVSRHCAHCTTHLLTLRIIKALTAPVVPNLKRRARLYNTLILPASRNQAKFGIFRKRWFTYGFEWL